MQIVSLKICLDEQKLSRPEKIQLLPLGAETLP
jgi:hypothetical protein